MRAAKRATRGFIVAGAMAAMLVACSGGNSGTPSPSPTPTPTPTPPPSGGTTITITATGVSPATITVARGTQVTFVNSDTKNHTMNSDPHPEHTACTEINSVGFIVPGQTKQTGNLNTARTCGFHDHELFTDTKWQGRIIVQ